ncbi:MAG: 3'(2'),5'-bisphosphate nucleotidase CysQ [Lachnospiraceae bacterium]|nr:3'(2'),5'-bisphosphate nucleotidase CysQ [Lachnospiraceae bacterium]
MDLKKVLDVSKDISICAGKAILEIYNKEELWQVEYKEGNMPLTLADKKAHEIIAGELQEKFPSCALLSEEGEDDRKRLDNPYCFVVDPLDGTKEFIKKNGQFTVNIALCHKGRPVTGVIYVPVTGELYYAGKGLGAYLDRGKETTRLHVSNRVENPRVVMSSSHGCEEMERLLEKYHLTELVRVGSSIKGCMIARGDAEIYYRHNPTMEWDTAAMQCIVEEAGAIFRQMDDSEMTYNRQDCVNRKGFYIINCLQNKLQG